MTRRIHIHGTPPHELASRTDFVWNNARLGDILRGASILFAPALCARLPFRRRGEAMIRYRLRRLSSLENRTKGCAIYGNTYDCRVERVRHWSP